MRAHADLAITYAREHPDWRDDQFAIDAIAKRVELVAEVASYRIPRQLWSDYPSIPWTHITGMRHRLVHGYDKMDLDILAETVERDLPKLIEQIEGLVGE
jgi:uncharacterized protein with HEPN domain